MGSEMCIRDSGTEDFEKVIKALRDADTLVCMYEGTNSDTAAAIRADAGGLREILIAIIAAKHNESPVDLTDDEYASRQQFLDNFDKIYTVNYDLLLYWIQMHNKEDEQSKPDDGFQSEEKDWDTDYVTWEPERSYMQNTWFLHRALHFFDAGTQVRKYTWNRTRRRLIDQIRQALEH